MGGTASMPASFIRVTAIGLAGALASPANAQLLNEKSLSAAMAMTIAQTALETCTKQGYHVSVHVLGCNGETSPCGARRWRPAAYDGEQPAQGLHLAHLPHSVRRVRPARQGQSDDWRGTPQRHYSGPGRLADQGWRRGHRRRRRLRRTGRREGRGLLKGRPRKGRRSAQVSLDPTFTGSAARSAPPAR